MELTGHYNSALVLFSIVIAIASSYTALSLIPRLSGIRTASLSRIQVISSGLVMGLGIWSMHFVAMLAFNMSMPVRYSGLMTLASMIVAIFSCIVGLTIVANKFSIPRIVVGGIFIGCGIVSMHYVGMSAMRMAATITYTPTIVIISALIGISASISALWVASEIVKRDLAETFKIKVPGSLIMGLAISGMHYTAMAGTQFIAAPDAVITMGGFSLDPKTIGVLLTLSILAVLSLSLWSSRMSVERDIVRLSEERLSAMTENITDALITIDSKGIVQSVNPATSTIFGYTPDEIIGNNVNMLMPSPWKESHDTYIKNYLETGNKKLIGSGYREAEAARKDGSVFPVDLAVSEALVAGERMYIGVIRDITERVISQQQLHYIAHHDSLTTLPNRFSFIKHIEQAIAHAYRRNLVVAILFLDLDRFKVINDTLGHDVGDYILQQFSQRLRDCVREGDIVSRLSGDEYTVLLDDVSAVSDIEPIATKIVNSLREPFIYQDHELFVSTSLGISVFPDNGTTPQALMRFADVAMYAAKEKGGNRYCFYDSKLDRNARERLSLESSLRHGLERGEFYLEYQPQVDLKNDGVTCVEALIRWQHPNHGVIPPSDFIPILEETGDIVQIGEWVIREACQQAKCWQDNGLPPVRIAVNISVRQFNEPDLAYRIQSIIRDIGLAPEYLELEITEGTLMQQTYSTLNAIQALHATGIKLAIDDFGTGYSSLSYLKRFPIDVLKIDKSFVRDIHTDSNDAAIVKLIIDMAHSLNLDVVAEGVENLDQLEYLKSQNCKSLQGYLYSHPLPHQKMTDYLQSHGETRHARTA